MSELKKHWLYNDALSYYMFEDTVVDEKGAHNGTATNITYDSGKFGRAAVFNGTSSKIDLANNFQLNTDFTITLWCVPNNITADQCFIGSWAGSSNFLFRIDGITLSGALMLINATSFTTNGKKYESTLIPVAGVRNFIALSYDNTADVATFYLGGDGKLFVSQAGTKTTWGAGAKAASVAQDIGDRDGSDFYDGKLEDFAIFTRALSGEEIRSIYNANLPQKTLRPAPFKPGIAR